MKMTAKAVVACASMLGSMSSFGAANVPSSVDWRTMLPLVRLAVRHAFPAETAEAHYMPSISRTVDLTGMGVQEAVVDLGAGAYTDEMTVVRMEGEQPVVARFKDKDDKIGPRVFYSGLADGKGEAMELRPTEHVVYSGHWLVSGVKVKHCGGEAYAWDGLAKSFIFSKKETKELTHDFCQRVEASGGKHA